MTWPATASDLYTRMLRMTGVNRMWAKKWCLLMFDAIDGPTDQEPEHDIDGSFEGRKNALHDVYLCTGDFPALCDTLQVSPEAVSEAFRAGEITRPQIEAMWRATRPD